MKLHLGPPKETTTLPCGCTAITRANGYDTVEPCMGHALQESGRAVVGALAKIEWALKAQTETLANKMRPERPNRRAGVLRRAWRRLFGDGW